jgi:hypothetical protein
VPFLVAPIVAVMAPSTAAASALAKGGLSRVAWLAWGGSVAAVSGVAAAVLLTQPAAPAPATLPPPPAPRQASVPPAPVQAEAAPETPVAPPVERRVSAGSPAVWDEPQLIERARKALAAEPRRALSLAQEHQRRFPAGALSVEREVIVIEALSRAGQTSEAMRRALSFEGKYPKSIHLPRIRALRERLSR